jgi:ATP-dependent Clp protease ATP-binding subunit ClpA
MALVSLFYFLNRMPQIYLFYLIGAVLFVIVLKIFLNTTKKQRTESKSENFKKSLQNINLKDYKKWLKENIIGHDNEIDRLFNSLKKNIVLSNPYKPLAIYMIIGPTGTGKTYLANLLSQVFYSDVEMIKIAMNQVKSPSELVSIFSEKGEVFEQLMIDNRRLVLLDEIDKTTPEVLHYFYSIFDSGTYISGSTTLNFKNVIFIATSNLVVEETRDIISLASNNLKSEILNSISLLNHFETPLLARFDDFFLFDTLRGLDLAKVALIELCKTWQSQDIYLSYVEPELIIKAIEQNKRFETYGVRHLSAVLHDLTKDLIYEAKRQGANKVKLCVRENNEFYLKKIIKKSKRVA